MRPPFSYWSSILGHRWVTIALSTIFWATFAYFLLIAVTHHILLVTNPHQLEYREGAVLIPTKLLLLGKNPYDLDYMPVAANVYGIVYPLLVYPFAKLLGVSLLTHRLVSGLFIALACLVLALILRREQVPLPHIAAGTLLFYQALLFFVGPLARPDASGEFFFLASLFIPYYFRYSNLSLLFSIILGLLAFYTKVYFILSLLYLSIYLFFFVSRIKGFTYASVGLALLTLSMLLVHYLLPTYFISTLLVAYNAAQHSLSLLADSGFGHMMLQFKLFFLLYGVLFIAALAGMLYRVHYYGVRNLANISAIFSICLVMSSVLMYLKFGRHDGNGLVYLLHLILPFVIITSLWLMSPLKNPLFALLLLVPISQSQSSFLPEAPTSQYCRAEWQQVAQLIANEPKLLASPVLTSLLLQQGKRVYDSGQTVYFLHAKPNNNLLDGVFFDEARLAARLTLTSEAIRNSIKQKEFSAIVMPMEIVTQSELALYYQPLDEINVCMPPFQDWRLVIYRPKP